MAKFIGAMDNYIPALTKGEKGHSQYDWTDDSSKSFSYFEETIQQISFQLVRTKTPKTVIDKYRDLLGALKARLEQGVEKCREYIIILIKLCAQTRDIENGKGECSLAYHMVLAIGDVFPHICPHLFERFVILEIDGKSVHPYGSWKDVKYFSQLCREKSQLKMNSFIPNLVNGQLKKDETRPAPSLLAKWIPREGSKYGWMFETLACDYFKNYMDTATTPEQKRKATTLCKMKYRKLVSSLNKKLDTTQIKQCAEQWKDIKPEKVTSVTLFRNKKAFLNINKKGEKRSYDHDRESCAYNFEEFLEDAKQGKVEVKGKRIGLADFAKEALEIISKSRYTKLQSESDMLNLQWQSNSLQNGPLDNMVAMVDVSGSMDGDPIHAAISLGIRVAEKSKLGKRVMTFTSQPKWVNLTGIDNYIDMVAKLKDSDWGNNTNFAAALEMILEVIVAQKMTIAEVKEITLVIFSDMMIDSGDKNYTSMYGMIESKYASAGMKVHGEPYTPPHIIFWNLRSTHGFPNLSKQKNTSMLSGFSPLLLNLFCEKGVSCLENFTPWTMLKESLDHPRYNVLEKIICENI